MSRKNNRKTTKRTLLNVISKMYIQKVYPENIFWGVANVKGNGCKKQGRNIINHSFNNKNTWKIFFLVRTDQTKKEDNGDGKKRKIK